MGKFLREHNCYVQDHDKVIETMSDIPIEDMDIGFLCKHIDKILIRAPKKKKLDSSSSLSRKVLDKDKYEAILDIARKSDNYEHICVHLQAGKTWVQTLIRRYERQNHIPDEHTIGRIIRSNRTSKINIDNMLDLVDQILSSSFAAVARELGVSDNAIRKRLSRVGIPVKRDEMFRWYEVQAGRPHPSETVRIQK